MEYFVLISNIVLICLNLPFTLAIYLGLFKKFKKPSVKKGGVKKWVFWALLFY